MAGAGSSTGTTPSTAGLVRRGLAYLLDCTACYAIFAAIHVPLFFLVIRDHVGIEWMRSGVWLELYTVTTISLPVWVYFAIQEASRRQATLGKRILGLRVEREDGQPLGAGRAIGRTAMKLLPWELAHLAVNLPTNVFIDPETGEFRGWDQGEFRWTFAGCYIVLAITVGLCLLDRERRRALHDRVVATVVRRVLAGTDPE